MVDYVLSIDRCNELTSLGLDMNDAKCAWFNFYRRGWLLTPLNDGIEDFTVADMKDVYGSENIIPTYTLQEIMEKLPNKDCELASLSQSVDIDGVKKWCCNYPSDPQDDDAEWFDSPLDAAYSLLKESLTIK